jgi:DNA-binding HxlR family transcriptional regulator
MTDCLDVLADCRLRAATELFAHRWTPLVLAALRDGPQRRSELRAMTGGMSDKVLTETVHRLTGNGLVQRRRSGARVDYALTALGKSLVEGPLAALGAWITEHGAALLEAQEAVRGFAGDRGA